MNLPIRVLIVDDHQMFREGVRSRLEQECDIKVLGEAASAEEALILMEQMEPTIAILDVRMPDVSGIDLTRIMRKRWPEVKILVLSGFDFDQYVRALARLGVDGYLLKDAPQDSLVDALREIASGGAVLPPNIASKLIRSYASQPSGDLDRAVWDLTLRELDVLEFLYQGLRNAEIAQHLSISPRTVETHVGNIIAKLGSQGRADAVRIAVEKGLIK